MVRVVGRGDLGSETGDFGGMELYAARVVAGDPLKLVRTLQDAMHG